MAAIPPDAGVRLRLQTDQSQLQPLASVRGIPSDLPDFQSGQVFSARIQEVLPDATYRALVAGRQLVLQLPEGANPGDILELKVVDRTANAVIAQRTENQASGADNRPYPYMRISNAGRLIGSLLPAEGETAPPAALNRSQPLLNQPPLRGADLAPILQKAVSQSGLFYEAHQAQWVAGERPLADLRAEPQGQLSPSLRQDTASQTPQSEVPSSAQAKVLGQTSEGTQTIRADGQSANTVSQSGNATNLPESIRNLVQQQLDAVATQRLAWHGEVWPGQTMDWAIQRDTVDEREAGEERTEASRWSTSLRLTMPRLGTIDAMLQVTGGKLSVRLAATPETAQEMRGKVASLGEALAGTGLGVQSIEIRRED